MERISQAVIVPIGISNPCSEKRREITRLKLAEETIPILSDSATELTVEAINCSDVLICEEDELATGKCGGCNPDLELQVPKDVENTGPSIELDHLYESFCCPSVIIDPSCLVTAKLSLIEVEVGMASKSMCNNVIAIKNPIPTELPLTAGDDPNLKMLMSVKNMILDTTKHIRFDSNYMPLWGCLSVCGGRQEMEDAAMTMPCFSAIPLWLLTNGNEEVGNMDPGSDHLTAHFFGAYDGHGGSQVADYCREHIHLKLVEEIRNLKNDGFSSFRDDCEKQWERAFTNCFRKVDADVSGSTGTISRENYFNFLAPETVGSTAVVAVVCSSHIIISNCGDSRAILYRGKEAVPLSEDHKVGISSLIAYAQLLINRNLISLEFHFDFSFQPKRADELARIESVGGKVIEWNGLRVSAVLAMSRSIGDRYLKPSIIPDPEVKFVPRKKEDECLIIATDGLWDVMTNEEACKVTRRRILLWHKNNTKTPPSERVVGSDPAAQAAADYLIKLAQHKGSKDNITVIVVDLKAQRKFKSKS